MTQELKELIEKVIGKEDGLPGLKVSEVKESPCTKPGDNFLSAVSVAEVVGTLPGGAPYSNTIFIKRPLNNPMFKELYQMDQAFSNEATVYLKLLPLFDKSMPFARCYHADQDLVILEDLGKSGYKMADRIKGFDLKTAKDVIKAMAKFHAASYQAVVAKKEGFIEATYLLKPMGVFTSNGSMVIEVIFQQILALLSEAPDLKSVVEYLKSIEGNLVKLLKLLREAGKIPVLSHGDFWINNILVRPGSEESVKLVDFQQCSGITSPVVDVLAFFYTSLQQEIMDDHFEELVQLYCEYFVRDLISMKVPTERIPSRRDVHEDLRSKELYGFLIGCLYLPAMTSDPETMPEIENMSEEQMSNSSFLQRINFVNFKDKLSNIVKIGLTRGVFNISKANL